MIKSLLFTCFTFMVSITTGQIIDWNNFDERHMDTVMFNVMNSYIDYKHPGDYLVWSPIVQKEVMSSNYDVIRGGTHRDIHSLHNKKWLNERGNSKPLPDSIKNKIIEENVNPLFLNAQKYTYKVDREGNVAESYGTFDYMEILISVPRNTRQTYQEIANQSIHSWNRSKEGHAGIMNANYKKKVIVGTTTFFCKKTQRVFISFVYVN